MYSIDGLNQIERKARKLHLTKACFQKYLNQNPPDKQSKDWIISRKNRFINGNGDYSKYGNALLQYDKIKFNALYLEWVDNYEGNEKPVETKKPRVLHKLNVLNFGKYKVRTINYVLKTIGDIKYLAWLYYGNDMYTFPYPMLEEIGIIKVVNAEVDDSLEIKKPSKDLNMYAKFCKQVLEIDMKISQKPPKKINPFKRSVNYANYLSKGALQSINHGR